MPIHAPISAKARRQLRILAVVGSVVLAEVVWATADVAFGLRLQTPANNGYPPMELGPLFVGVTAALLSLVAWAVLAILERASSHARVVWLFGAPLILLASLALPLSGTGVSDANRAVLVLLHIGVAAILIPVFSGTSPPRTSQHSLPAQPISEESRREAIHRR